MAVQAVRVFCPAGLAGQGRPLPLRAAERGSQSLCGYFASMSQGVVSEGLLKTLPRVPPFPHSVEEVRSLLISCLIVLLRLRCGPRMSPAPPHCS